MDQRDGNLIDKYICMLTCFNILLLELTLVQVQIVPLLKTFKPCGNQCVGSKGVESLRASLGQIHQNIVAMIMAFNSCAA